MKERHVEYAGPNKGIESPFWGGGDEKRSKVKWVGNGGER